MIWKVDHSAVVQKPFCGNGVGRKNGAIQERGLLTAVRVKACQLQRTAGSSTRPFELIL